ncbi:MAG TPA: sulfite exporter TauE/SafE family protein [Chthoniobacteraceae bacterium]|jgi:hypothetical protein|nr:sulfite exporter TauE/SafE family protein [Chthoniobacteraceae bacterium]
MTLPPFTPLQWILAAIAALCIGLSKSGFPGVAMISVLLMAELMRARVSIGVILPLLICGDVLAAGSFRKHVRWPYIWRVLPVTLAGILIGYWLLKLPLREGFFKVLIGGIILALVILQGIRMRKPSLGRELPPGGPAAIGAGVACGVTTMVANAAGPVMAIYLIAMGLAQFDFVGTSAIFFLIVNLVKIPFSLSLGLINARSLSLDLVLAPAVAAGIFTGRALLARLPRRAFEILVLFLAGLSAVKLMIDAI